MVISKREKVTKHGFRKIVRGKFRLPGSLSVIHFISISISLSLKSISEFSGAASSISDIVTSASGLVAREANTAYLSLVGGAGGRGMAGAYSRLGAY